MEDIYLIYDEDSFDFQNLEQFFKYQNIIRKDLERIRYLVSDYKESEERTELLSNLDYAIDNIENNRFQDTPLMQLEILIQGKYLAFSYFRLEEDGNPLTSEPTFIIITREMKHLYFINKVSTIIKNRESDYVGLDNPYENFNRYSVDCYQLEKDRIMSHSVKMEGYPPVCTCFEDTDELVEKIKSKFQEKVSK